MNRNNVLLFGARGHLAKTKLIPAIKQNNMSYIPLSRQKVIDLQKYKCNDDIAYMSIPTQYFFDSIEPYEQNFKENSPLFVLEKPHGISYNNFLDIKNYFDENNYSVVYNDHYIAKDSILNLKNVAWPSMKNIESITLKFHESQCVNSRIHYFDNAGILLDMYQSHALIVLSSLIAYIANTDRIEIIETLSGIVPSNVQYDKYSTYKGKADTSCIVDLIYNGIPIHISCGKMLHDEKSLCVKTFSDDDDICIDLSNEKGNPYDKIFEWLSVDYTDPFLSSYEVKLLWQHIKQFT